MILYRYIQKNEAGQAAHIEAACFPPSEACTEKMMTERVNAVPELFMVAVDSETGKLAGFLCGLATNETSFRDEFFSDTSLHDPAGDNVVLLGLDVLPEYRMRGIAKTLMDLYKRDRFAEGKKRLILTCKTEKAPMYEKMGFVKSGPSSSLWGGIPWEEMHCDR
ncbi:MAG: GNAT family N-acetyltransferase [Clostridia bacterium]|nr:GNAT family N-acetyltransferase [Clostridia bacterium]